MDGEVFVDVRGVGGEGSLKWTGASMLGEVFVDVRPAGGELYGRSTLDAPRGETSLFGATTSGLFRCFGIVDFGQRKKTVFNYHISESNG